MQDRACLTHLDHEGGLAAHQIVARANSSEDPVRDPDVRRSRWDKASDLRHQNDEPDLTQDRGLAGHVRPGKNYHARILYECHVIRNELLTRHHPLHYRMSPAHNPQVEPVTHRRPHISLGLSHFTKCRVNVSCSNLYVNVSHAPYSGCNAPHALSPSSMSSRHLVKWLRPRDMCGRR